MDSGLEQNNTLFVLVILQDLLTLKIDYFLITIIFN